MEKHKVNPDVLAFNKKQADLAALIEWAQKPSPALPKLKPVGDADWGETPAKVFNLQLVRRIPSILMP